MTGAREGAANWLRRLAARALARDLTAFVVPGPELARAHGLDLAAAGLRPVATPRHAGVLVLIGELPAGLARAAAVAYAQMGRPRAILALGAPEVGPLPAPDVAAALRQDALAAGVAELRRLVAAGAFSLGTAPFDVAAVRTETRYTCPMHPEIVRDQPGKCPICGMDLVPQQEVGRGPGHDATTMDHSGTAMGHDATTVDHGGASEHGSGAATGAYTCPMHPEIVRDAPGSCPICGMDLVPREEEGEAADRGATALQHGLAHGEGPGGTRRTYTCPMHPEVVRAGPGSCPICGMDLLPRAEAVGGPGSAMDGSHAAHRRRDAGMAGAVHGGQGHQGRDGGGDHGGMGHGARDTAQRLRRPDRVEGADGVAAAAGHTVDADHAAHGGREYGGHHTVPRGGTDQNAMPGMAHEGRTAMPGMGGGQEMPGMAHGAHDMGAMDHSMHDMSGGFMSMVAMTRDLPRSRDGLPMEWTEAPFGPLFPGLPGGLDIALTLDGDVVARVARVPGAAGRGLAATWPGPAATLPDRLASLDPLAPFGYRLLAWRALESAAGTAPDERAARARVGALERERAASHLGWLAGFGDLLGYRWLAERAAALQLAFLRAAEPPAAEGLAPAIRRLIGRVERTPLLRRRLAGVGRLDAGDPARRRGPVARAGGAAEDARVDDPAYRALGFASVVREGDDALARLQVRLAELDRSLDLIRAAGAGPPAAPAPAGSGAAGGPGMATVETPRGAATLHLTLGGGTVCEMHLDTPSAAHADLIPAVAEGRELADALVGIASLDLSPWEIDR